ncbi:MAG: hypothetical protein WCP97_09445 [bacterium]
MSAIKGLEGISGALLDSQLKEGGKFVIFPFCISILVMSFKRKSPIHYIRPGQGTFGLSVGYILASLFLGWWGIPWGPIWTIQTIYQNLNGGKDVTAQVVASLSAKAKTQ